MRLSRNLEIAIEAALLAGKEIMNIYEDDIEILNKSDNSPLTIADTNSNFVINSKLKETSIPIISEENNDVEYDQRKNWKKIWMVDPLDGTKEFINKNGEFTVNIALIENNFPSIGVVYAPFYDEIYFGENGLGAYKLSNINNNFDLEKAIKIDSTVKPENYTIIVSRSHVNDKTLNFIKEKKKIYNDLITISHGSSLKICKVADGSANCYPRFGPTYEWDTAASHVIAKLTNCYFKSDLKKDLKYNKKNLLNPSFITEKK